MPAPYVSLSDPVCPTPFVLTAFSSRSNLELYTAPDTDTRDDLPNTFGDINSHDDPGDQKCHPRSPVRSRPNESSAQNGVDEPQFIDQAQVGGNATNGKGDMSLAGLSSDTSVKVGTKLNALAIAEQDQRPSWTQINNSTSPPALHLPTGSLAKLLANKAPELLPKADLLEELFQEVYITQTRGHQEEVNHNSQQAFPAQAHQQQFAVERAACSSSPQRAAFVPAKRPFVSQLLKTEPPAEEHFDRLKLIDEQGNVPQAPLKLENHIPRPIKHELEMDEHTNSKKAKLSAPEAPAQQSAGTAAAVSPSTKSATQGPSSLPRCTIPQSLIYKLQLKELRATLKADEETFRQTKHVDKYARRDREIQIMLLRTDVEKVTLFLRAQLAREEASAVQSGAAAPANTRSSMLSGINGINGPVPLSSIFMLKQVKILQLELRTLEARLKDTNRPADDTEVVAKKQRIEDLRVYIRVFEGNYKTDREKETKHKARLEPGTFEHGRSARARARAQLPRETP